MRISAGATVRVLGMMFTATQLTLVAIAAVALAALHGLLRYTRLGKAMRATASDPELARNCGVQTRRVIDGAWLLSGLLCGLAGVALVTELGSFDSRRSSSSSRRSRRSSLPKPRRRPTRRTWPSCSSWAT